MKTYMVILILVLTARFSAAQDTAYVSRDKATALFFPSSVKVISSGNKQLIIADKGNGVLAVRAAHVVLEPQILTVQEESSKKRYRIPVIYSYGKAGRRIGYGRAAPVRLLVNDRPERPEQVIAQQLALGKRGDVATHEKAGGVKAWINKISLSGNRIYMRLDLRNRSNLPFGIDFVRFYIRDRKTVNRMATHEQEILPLYSTLRSRNDIVKGQEVAKVFAFKRFSLSEDEALFIEVYERSGNRHLYLQVKPGDLDDIKVIPTTSFAPQTLAAAN